MPNESAPNTNQGDNTQGNSQNTGQGAGQAPSWISTLPDELKGYVENKGFKDPATVVSSYRELEKIRGIPKERLLTLPEKPDAPEWNDVYNRLGRPAKAEEYGFQTPEGGNKEFTEWSKNTFYEAGLTAKQAEKLAAKWNEYAQAQVTKHQEVETETRRTQEANLRKEWGAAYDQNYRMAKKAFTMFGANAEAIDKLENTIGFDGVMKFLANVASKVGEDDFHSSDRGTNFKGGALSPAAANDRIKTLMSDVEWRRKFANGDADAKAEWSRLHEYAVPRSDAH